MPIEEKVFADGNLAVQEFWRHWGQEILKGEIQHVSCQFVWNPTKYASGQAGVGGMEFATAYAALDLMLSTRESIKNRSAPPMNTDSPEFCTYNCSKLPCSFDYYGWLVNRLMEKNRAGITAPLKVRWYFGADNNVMGCLNTQQRFTNFHGIMRQLNTLFGAEEVPAEAGMSVPMGHSPEELSFRPIVAAYKNGEKLPPFAIPEERRAEVEKALGELFGGQKPVVLTLREAEHSPHRNIAGLDEWLKFGNWLQDRGEKVLFIRDTAKANELITGFHTCPPASQDLVVRTAIYQYAKANVFVSNGPAILATWDTDVPWLIFTILRDDQPGYWGGTTDGWRISAGIDPHTQSNWPWSRPWQQIIWKPDTFENMRDAWLEHLEPHLTKALPAPEAA